MAFAADRVGRADTYYAPEERYWFGRVSEVKNFSEALGRRGETVLCLEIPDARLGPDVDYTARVPALVDQLRDANILRGSPMPGVVAQRHLPRVYPVRVWLNGVLPTNLRRTRGRMVLPKNPTMIHRRIRPMMLAFLGFMSTLRCATVTPCYEKRSKTWIAGSTRQC